MQLTEHFFHIGVLVSTESEVFVRDFFSKFEDTGFPTGVANMGRSSKFDGGGLESKHGGAWGELKMLSKNTCEGVHLNKMLPAISPEASKFTKNKLLHTSFSKILVRF